MTMIRIACVGITVMDRIYYVEDLPTEGGKYVAKRYTEVGGGPAATAAVAAAKAGRRWTLLAGWAMTTPEKAAGGAGIPGGKYPLHPALCGAIFAIGDYG
jgi:sulfofructose kinase